jgi:hypothetical protein
VSSAVFRAPLLLALALFTPLIAGWSILVGIAVSRSRDVRVVPSRGSHNDQREPYAAGATSDSTPDGVAARVRARPLSTS